MNTALKCTYRPCKSGPSPARPGPPPLRRPIASIKVIKSYQTVTIQRPTRERPRRRPSGKRKAAPKTQRQKHQLDLCARAFQDVRINASRSPRKSQARPSGFADRGRCPSSGVTAPTPLILTIEHFGDRRSCSHGPTNYCLSPLVKVEIVFLLPPALHIPCFEDYTVVFYLLDIGMRTQTLARLRQPGAARQYHCGVIVHGQGSGHKIRQGFVEFSVKPGDIGLFTHVSPALLDTRLSFQKLCRERIPRTFARRSSGSALACPRSWRSAHRSR